MKVKILKFLSIGVILSLELGLMLFSFPTGTVQAAGSSEETTPPTGEKDGIRKTFLEKRYQAELRMLAFQGRALERADKFTARIEDLIARLKENGKDTSVLEAALAEFGEKMIAAQAAHEKAAGILSTHAGFDENGKVTDREQARDTLRTAGESLREANREMRSSMGELRKALKEWREAHPPAQREPAP